MLAASSVIGGRGGGGGGGGGGEVMFGVGIGGGEVEDKEEALYKETERLIGKRQQTFKARYEAEAKLASRNKALVQLVKVSQFFFA